MKICTACKCFKHTVDFSLSKRFRDGFRRDCKACERVRALAWRNKNIERARQSKREWDAKNTEHRLSYRAKYYEANSESIKAKARESSKEYRIKNRALCLERERAYAKANREVIRAKARAYAAANRDDAKRRAREWRKKNPKRYLANVKAYEAAHPELRRMRTRLRRQGIASAAVKWADRAAIREVYRRARELSNLTGIPHHVDHIIPLKGKEVCGLHVETNLRIVPYMENIAKGNRLLEVA